MQNAGDVQADRYFYLSDRLGSVRLILDATAAVQNRYTYKPFGKQHPTETEETITSNPWQFTGQYYDKEIKQYHLRARQYDPHITRFTTKDPITGRFTEPLTLHAYLYCANEPVSRTDPLGLFIWQGRWPTGEHFDAERTQEVIYMATALVGSDFVLGPWLAFSRGGPGRFGIYDMKDSDCTFTIHDSLLGDSLLQDTEFGNYLAGYTTYYNYGILGEIGNRSAGHYYSILEYQMWDQPDSKYFISAGILKALGDRGGARGIWERLSYVNAKSQLYYGIELMTSVDDITGSEFDSALKMFRTFWDSGSLRGQ